MFTIKQPSEIIFGKNSALEYDFPKKSLLITSSGAEKREWFSNLNLDANLIFNDVESNPSIETTNTIIEKFKNQNFSTVVGLGGGSVLDVAKFVGYKTLKKIYKKRKNDKEVKYIKMILNKKSWNFI